MTKQKSLTDAVAELNRKAREGSLDVVAAHVLTDAGRAVPDILVFAAAAPAFDAGCMFLVPVAGRGVFTRAAELSLNGVYGFVGPAPNERLGVIDVLFTSDMAAKGGAGYTGLHLFTDAILDHELNVFCRSMENTEHRSVTRLSKMQFARMTIYDAAMDPEFMALAGNTLFPGARLRVNGGDAIVAGSGARSVDEAPSLSLIADLFPMRPELLLCDANGVMARHNLTFAIPMAAVAEPEALLKRVLSLIAGRGGDASRLAEAEDDLAAALRAGTFHQADPGPQTV
ncbi:MAG TPA: hypothetical protein IAB01_03965 [Candidatus Avidesulfovibrio excrementigallinarum]|nr:hypothetical protein [Candidatus Avidesulfovibrio excrementigallinarum]